MRRFLGSLLVAVILLFASCLVFGQGLSTPAESDAEMLKKPLPEGVSQGWYATVQKDIAANEYHLSPPSDSSKGLYQAPNRAQGFRSLFTEKGVKLCPREGKEDSWQWGLEAIVPSDLERRIKKESLKKTKIQTSENKIEFDRGWLKEWFVNSPEGLEQGFTVEKKFNKDTKLNIDMKLTGSLHPRFANDGQSIDFYDNGSVAVLTYSKLKVTDSTGQVLPAKFVGVPGAIRIEVDDSKAVYPVTVDPIATSPSWMAEGDQSGAHFGISVSTAGDVNGDGYSDVIIGAQGYDGGQADEGRAYLYLGSASGLSSFPSWNAESNQAGALFGGSVATAGDVNGDGFADILVDASYFSNGNIYEGMVFLFTGSFSGPGPFPAWTGEGNQDSAHYGSSATAGDVNGDGYSDVIVGAWDYDNGQSNEGRAYLYLGSASGLSSSPAWTAESDLASANFGRSVATAGDVNGDGYSDVIVGAERFSNGQTFEGRAYLYFGSASGLSSSPSWTAESDQDQAFFGYSVATAGDVNGDGYSDVVVGAPYYDSGQADEGMAYLYLGSSLGLLATPAWTAEGDQSGANLGRSVRTAGDVNGDGYSDVIVGVDGYANSPVYGRACVYFGSTAGLSSAPTWIAEGDQSGSRFGWCVDSAGDVNGDGFSDVIVGAHYYDNGEYDEGAAFVFHGGPSGPNWVTNWYAKGVQADEYFGDSVASAGDVNGDGFGDIIFGAPGYDSQGGRALLYQGGATGPTGTPSWETTGEGTWSSYGDCVTGAGDVNGDGYSDVVVSDSSYDTSRGKVYLYLGSGTGLSATCAWTAEGGAYSNAFGLSAATAGDVNGDGYSDLIVGECGHSGNTGKAYVFHGGSSGLSTLPSWTALGEAIEQRFGYSVASAGDVNGDGYSDVIIGVYGDDDSPPGKAYLYSGSPSGLSAIPSWTASIEGAGNGFAFCVATAGDVNGDGFSDVIVGAPYYDHPENDEGAAFIYFGSSTGLGSVPQLLEADFASGHFGWSVATAGDMNGDGFSDVIVGEPLYESFLLMGRGWVYPGSPSGLGEAFTYLNAGTIGNLGVSVAAAGDVNGDGYCDALAGSSRYDEGAMSTGAALLFYGNGGPGVPLKPMQRQVGDMGNISHLGMSSSDTAFNTKGTGRTPYGRGLVKGEWEVKPLGTPFNATGMSQTPAWTDTGVSGTDLSMTNSNLSGDTDYHWRMRFLYKTSTTPFQQRSRWFTIPVNGWQEADLKTDCRPLAMPSLTVTDKDACSLSGITVTWPAVPGAVIYDIDLGGTVVQNVTSPHSYEPGDSTTKWYAVCAKNVCGESQWSLYYPGADANDKPGPVTIDSITDNDPCAYGITIDYSGGDPSESYDLLRDGVVVETGITDPFVHNPPDLNQHFYEVRAKNFSCYTTSAPVNFTEVYDAPSLPTMDSFAEVDGCVQNGIKIYFTGGTPSTRHDLYKDFTLVQSNVTSPVTYDPGDTASHWYHIRTYNNTCYNQPMPAQYADEVWPPPTQPAITTITDLDPCQMSGIEVYFNEGAPATRHDLYIDGIEAVHGPFTSPLTYLAPDALPHTYTIRAYNNSCFTASAGVVGTDANNTAIPVISGPHENTCPSETVTLTTQSGMSDYQWYSYGSPLGGEISDTIVIGMGGDGSYSVSFANAGCSATSSEHLVTIMPCPAAPPPAPDGSGGTEPVRVAKLQDDGSQLRVTWDAHSCPAADYGIVWGNLSEVSSYLLQGGICSLGTSESFDWPCGEGGDLFFFILGVEDGVESNWGTTSGGQPCNGENPSNICSSSRSNATTCP